MTDRITTADVEYVAQLARLELEPEEIERYTGQLEAILEHAAQLDVLDVEGVEPTAHPFPLRNVLRADVARPGIDRDVVLAEAPEAEDGRFRVPRILDES